jgi:hypothetical protein
LFVSSVLFVFWYHSPNFLDTPRIYGVFLPQSELSPSRARLSDACVYCVSYMTSDVTNTKQ